MTREILITWAPNQRVVRALVDDGVRFLVIGGTAVQFHEPTRRQPSDLDLVVEPLPMNLVAINAALRAEGAPEITASPADFARPSRGYRDKHICNRDIFTPFHAFDFEEHWRSSLEAVIAFTATHLRVASIGTLKTWLRHALAVEPLRGYAIQEDLEILANASST